VAPKIAAKWGVYDRAVFPLTLMNYYANWSSTEFRSWVESSQIKVAVYSNNADQINWNYKPSVTSQFDIQDAAHTPDDWERWDINGNVIGGTGTVGCSPVSGPYTTYGTFRWHLIENDSYPLWWKGSKGVFWDMMNLHDEYGQIAVDYKPRAEPLIAGFLKLIRETRISYWSYVISNTFYSNMHVGIVGDLDTVEAFRSSSVWDANLIQHVLSTMKFVNNIPKQYRPNILIYQYYNTLNQVDQADVYGALFGAARYRYNIELYSEWPNPSSLYQLHNLKMGEAMFRAMGYSRDDDTRDIYVETLDITGGALEEDGTMINLYHLAEGNSLTTPAQMVVFYGGGTWPLKPTTITFTKPFDYYVLTNLNESQAYFQVTIPSTANYAAGSSDIIIDTSLQLGSTRVITGRILAEKTANLTKQ
jgi:hypothetical protein